jgi:NCS1 family nucleobase:cation symporter-1
MLLNAHAGTRYGIPFPVFLRSSFGIFGANIPAMMRALVACGWFGIQTWIGGSAMYRLFVALFPNEWTLPNVVPEFIGISTGELLAFLLFWFINVAIIWRGIDSIRILQTWSAPFLLATGAALFIWAWWNVGSLGAMLGANEAATRSWSSAMLGAGITSGVAFWGTLALNIPDFARFARSQRDQIVGQTLGLVPTMALFSFIGAAVTNATILIYGARVGDPVELLSRMGSPLVTVLAMLGIAVATLTTNLAANIVSPANDFSNLRPSVISFRRGAMIAATLGIVMMPWKLYINAADYLFTWLIGYGALLGSVGGIMIVDYFILRGRKLDVADLYRRDGQYRFHHGFNWHAMLALFLGIAPNIPGFLMALGLVEGSPFWTGLYDRGWFVAFFCAGLCHFVFAKSFGMKKYAAKQHA